VKKDKWGLFIRTKGVIGTIVTRKEKLKEKFILIHDFKRFK